MSENILRLSRYSENKSVLQYVGDNTSKRNQILLDEIVEAFTVSQNNYFKTSSNKYYKYDKQKISMKRIQKEKYLSFSKKAHQIKVENSFVENWNSIQNIMKRKKLMFNFLPLKKIIAPYDAVSFHITDNYYIFDMYEFLYPAYRYFGYKNTHGEVKYLLQEVSAMNWNEKYLVLTTDTKDKYWIYSFEKKQLKNFQTKSDFWRGIKEREITFYPITMDFYEFFIPTKNRDFGNPKDSINWDGIIPR